MTKEEAQKVLLDNTEKSVREELLSRVRKVENETQEEVDKKAKEMMSLAIERCASSHAAEHTSATIALPSDDMKGRIIGREGRNIRMFEMATGVDLIIDDTPEAVSISGFDPIRREIARLSLEKLVQDGRIHPARIEEIVGKN